MSQLKDFTYITAFTYAVILLQQKECLYFTILSLILYIMFILKYLRLSSKISAFEQIKQECLKKQKENFIDILSHDLRIPLIAQVRALELLDKEDFGKLSPIQNDIVLQIKKSCMSTLNIMSLLINTYNMENNIYKLYYERFNLSEIVITCFNELSQEAAEKNITFELLNNNNLYLKADKHEIKKVIYNLLSNALISSQYGTKVSVLFNITGRHLQCRIKSDNNIQDSNQNNNYATVGQKVKINFCKKIIQNHNGHILKQGNSNIFAFELPYACE